MPTPLATPPSVPSRTSASPSPSSSSPSSPQPTVPPTPSSSRLTSFLTSTLPNATFRSDDSVLRTGEDFLQPISTDSPSIILSDVSSDPSSTELECDPSSPIDCTDLDTFHITMRAVIEHFPDIHFYRFGTVEPDNYWYRVCEGETESVIQRPWHLISKSRRLMEILSAVASKLNSDFDSVHIVRGEKAKNTELWPNLVSDTSPEALLSTLQEKVDDGRNLYIATNEPDTSIFDPLKDKYTTHFLDDYKELWGENSESYIETKQLNNGIPVDFDGYMRVEVDTEVFLMGKKQIETFNDLTSDCKDGVNTCHATA